MPTTEEEFRYPEEAKETKQVREFHTRIGGAIAEDLPGAEDWEDGPEAKVNNALAIAMALVQQAEDVLVLSFRECEDQRTLRAKLVISESAELILGLIRRDEVEVLDALADILYVTHGCAVTFDLPLTAAFIEVHRSNMTKGPAAAAHDPDTNKGKGPRFSPANLQEVLERARYDRQMRGLQTVAPLGGCTNAECTDTACYDENCEFTEPAPPGNWAATSEPGSNIPDSEDG